MGPLNTPPAYGGTSYYPPPPYQQPYPVVTPPPISGPPPAPPIHPPLSNTSGPPSTSSYSTSESATPSYVPYGAAPPQNPYFPFPRPPQPMAPPHHNAGVNFVQPSVTQQYQNFEQLNTTNPTHPSNNAKQGWNWNHNNPGQGGNQPQQHPPAWGNQNQGNQNPQGGNNYKCQGRNNIKTIHPCALCGEFSHYTHHFPQIVDFKRFKDSGSLPPSPAQPAPQQAPQQYAQQPPTVLQNPIPHQGVINTQQDAQRPPPQMGQSVTPGTTQPRDSVDRSIFLTNEEIHLQTCSRQYSTPLDSTSTTSETRPAPIGQPLMIPRPNAEPIPRIPQRNVHNPHAQAAHYSLVDDLSQSPAAISVLEVLQTCPSQRKSLISALGALDTADTQLITIGSDNGEPRLPAQVAFQIPVKIWNTTVYRCIIDEGASTCIMSKDIWQKIGSLELVPSTISLRAYDGRPTSPIGLCQNFPIELGGKTILIDIEVIDAQLDYNILFGRNYMYAMKAVASSVFRTMMFPHNGKIVTIDQLTHYEPNHPANIGNIVPLVHVFPNDFPVAHNGSRLFQDPPMVSTCQETQPFLNPSFSAQVCVISSKGTDMKDTLPSREASIISNVPLVAELPPHEPPANSSTPPLHEFTSPPGHIPVWETVPQAITRTPFFYPPPGIKAFQVATTLTLPNMVLALPVWYLHPPAMVPQPPPITNPPATAGGRRMKKEPIAPLPLHIPPPGALREKDGHPTPKCPSIPELQNLIPLNPTPSPLATLASTTTTSPNSSSKGLRTKFACAICSSYGHYTHHFPSIPYVRHTLAAARHTSLLKFPLTPHTNAPTDVIYYTSSSILEQRGSTCLPPKQPPDRPIISVHPGWHYGPTVHI
jgi:hypothetical protein